MPRGKLILYTILAIALALAGGWLWGASGRFSVGERARNAEQRADLADARARILDARIALFQSNFGDAGRSLEMARRPLERARDRYRERGQQDLVALVEEALQRVDAARRAAGQLDASANARAAEAVTLVEKVTSGSLPSPPR
ncbi:MAG: hypothetical protein ACRD1S_08675 [Vicinamibacterales bacterium]